jgi:hypothetical protein
MLGRKLSGNNEIYMGFSAFLLCLFENVVNFIFLLAVYVVEDLASIPDRSSEWFVFSRPHADLLWDSGTLL